MEFPRRRLLHLAAGAAALSALPRSASALDYPTHPVHLVCGYGAGSAPDVVARLIGQWLMDRTGQAFVVDNRPGAGTNLSTEAVAHATPDGYTLLIVATPNMITDLLHHNLSFNFLRDVAPVAAVGSTPFVVIANPDFPPKTIPELIAYAKANPGKVNFASNGTGNLTHIAGELFKMMAGVDLFHVPYHGEVEAQTDLLAGRVQIMFDPIISAIGHVRAGKLHALAVTTANKIDTLPETPTVNESVPGYVVLGWLGIGATAGTPAEIVAKLNADIVAGLADDNVRSHLVNLGSIPTKMTPAEYGKLFVEEKEKWAKVIKFADIKLD
jgi:tripartite-type tricarboxylate transporter receptor subunit TctC